MYHKIHKKSWQENNTHELFSLSLHKNPFLNVMKTNLSVFLKVKMKKISRRVQLMQFVAVKCTTFWSHKNQTKMKYSYFYAISLPIFSLYLHRLFFVVKNIMAWHIAETLFCYITNKELKGEEARVQSLIALISWHISFALQINNILTVTKNGWILIVHQVNASLLH